MAKRCVFGGIGASSTYKVISSPKVHDPSAKISSLIDGDSLRWNATLLTQIFPKEEIKIIQSLPLSKTNQEDRQIWKATANGIFTVGSAYHM
jgi:hypothetical protein